MNDNSLQENDLLVYNETLNLYFSFVKELYRTKIYFWKCLIFFFIINIIFAVSYNQKLINNFLIYMFLIGGIFFIYFNKKICK